MQIIEIQTFIPHMAVGAEDFLPTGKRQAEDFLPHLQQKKSAPIKSGAHHK